MSGENTRNRILIIASKHFAMRGYAGTRLSDIALECGIKRPSVLYYFASKIELAQAVIEKQHSQCKDDIFEPLKASEHPVKEKAELAINNIRTFLKEHSENPMVSFLFATHITEIEQAVRRYYETWLSSLKVLLAGLHTAERADELAKLSLFVIKGYLSTARLFGPGDDLELSLKFLRGLWLEEKETASLMV